MSGIWYLLVPEAGTNQVLNPSAEAADNYGGLFVGSPSVSASPSGSASPSASQSRSPSASVSPSASQSTSPSASQSRSPSASASSSGSASPSTSVSPSPSPSFGVAAVSRVTTYARFGDYCYSITTPKPYDGLWLTLSTLTNATHYVSLYLFDNVTGTPEASLDGHTFYAMSVIGGRDTGWLRYGVSIPASEANGSKRVDIRMPTEEDFYVDAVQVEANSYGTTYIDGDRGELYRWSGLRHGSASTRSAQERAGGRERNLLDDYGVEVVEGTKRIGMPPVIHNLQSLSLLPGALYQGVKVLPREIELHLNYSSDSWAGFHGKRNDVIDLLKPDLTRGSQPVIIGYAGPGTDKKVYSKFYYNGGMEFGDFLAYDETAAVRLLAPDPFWEADDQETASLDYQDSVSNAAYALRRHDGQWKVMGTGFNGTVRCIRIDAQRNRIWFCGAFTTANGITVNRVCYWDGTTFIPVGSGATKGVAGGTAYGMAIAENGDVWIVGDFTSAGGATTVGIARWNNSTDTFTVYNLSTSSGTGWFGAAIDRDGILYACGDITNWNGTAAIDFVVQYDGTTWSAVGTSPFSASDYCNAPEAVKIDLNDDLIVGSSNTPGGRVRKWDGSAWTLLGEGNASSVIWAIFIDDNNTYVIGGNFTTIGGVSANNIAIYNGTTFVPLGTGVGDTVNSISKNPNGLICVSGVFSSAGGITLADRIAFWNGSAWVHPDLDLPGSPNCYANLFNNGGDIFLGFDTTGTATAAGLTTATNGGSTATYPRLSVINGNSSGSCILQWFENQSSDHRMYFNLTVQAGESVVLDLANSQKRLTSDWRGRITDNPLKNSDVTNWKLLPGANTIAAFITGTVTSVVALLHWTPRYWSADGAA